MGAGNDTRLPVAIIVAHPDDETLWAGGTILLHPQWQPVIYTLCRRSDPDRAPRYARVLAHLGAVGAMGDLDDGPTQEPLDPAEVQATVAAFIREQQFALVLTHALQCEYSPRHRRHQEVFHAVCALWQRGVLQADGLWFFAYEDGGGRYLPQARATADLRLRLPPAVWQAKHHLLHAVYGFGLDSWEVRTTPRAEAFWRVGSLAALEDWIAGQEEA
jgi:LmbE family N-acetylglucosaminyl deacetylase